MNRRGLTDAMSPGDGLIINGRIPMWRDDIQIGIGLHIETFRTGIDLNKQDIRTKRIHDVLRTNSTWDATVNVTNGESALQQAITQRVDLSKIVTEDNLPAHLATFDHAVNDSIEFGGSLRSIGDLMITHHLSISLNVRIHQFGTDTCLATADQSRQDVPRQEGRRPRDTIADETREAELGMELFREVLFEVIIAIDVDHLLRKSGKLNTDFGLGATKNSLAEQSAKGAASTRVERPDQILRKAKHVPISIKIHLSVVDGSASDQPDEVDVEHPGSVEQGVAVAEVMGFVHDETTPGESSERGLKVRNLLLDSMFRRKRVVGRNDDRGGFEVVLGDEVPFGTVVEQRSVPTEGLESVDPLVDESGRKNDERSLEEVRDDQSKNLNGLAETHLIADETPLAYLLSPERRRSLDLDSMFLSEAPLKAFNLVGFFSRTGFGLAPCVVPSHALFEEGVECDCGRRVVAVVGIFDGGATDGTGGCFVVSV